MIFTPVRPTIQWFAQRMEQTLRLHDARKKEDGWKFYSLAKLKNFLTREMVELNSEFIKRDKNYKRIVEECIDVANMAMMIADNAQTILEEKEEIGS